ncbi:dihydroxyacetone kinase family protein [Humibacter albus]|uniref:dihydroxyacetone kinase family protein n=1 Tax=Humibacter albus TaxID=427754 RepID=UPI0003B5B956|nr:dihydroxyacetone kinase family protein [Humibacter albus]
MTRLWNDPADFADEATAGFVAANGRHVRAVAGGVVRNSASPTGEVAVVIGGGSGHYPAFAGLVGTGLAHGAAMGNLFASPSTQQVLSVAKAAENGGGVLLTYGNYAGDVLNFGAAQEQLRTQGIRCETVTVTDDVMSAPRGSEHQRRGIAGDLVVFRIAAAAAGTGHDLDVVAHLARRANARTRSVGVAFSGCALPGADTPLFDVPEGRMAVGLGIHGEPGIAEAPMPSADELAGLLVTHLLQELPDAVGRGSTVVPILNGLGSLKYEELFVVYRRIDELLREAGFGIDDPHVGEYCTSFDMAGCSLTLFWPDDELARLWDSPADAPAYRKGASIRAAAAPASVAPTADDQPEEQPATTVAATTTTEPAIADELSRAAAVTVRAALDAIATTVDAHVDELGRLDAIAGDGDHGIGMQRGAHAALAAGAASAASGAGAGTVLEQAADAWSDKAGGTSGALWGVMLARLAVALGDTRLPCPRDVAAGVAAATAGVMSYGKAALGDKTMVDALEPFSAELTSAVDEGHTLAAAWRSAAEVATTAAASTADLLPRKGRARPHGEKSLGVPDPGAHSFALIVSAVAGVLESSDEGNHHG